MIERTDEFLGDDEDEFGDVCDKCVEWTENKCEHDLCSACCGCTGAAEPVFEDR